METFTLNSFFSGAGGLDQGFQNAGFITKWANEYDKNIRPTFAINHPNTILDPRSLFDIPANEIPNNATGIIGGPPCQSWSIGGLGKGLEDNRGQAFIKYLQIIDQKKPLFFLAENVKGMLAKTREKDLTTILKEMDNLGYNLSYKLVNTADYGVPQDRYRVIFIGYSKQLNKQFLFPEYITPKITLKNMIWDLRDTAVPAQPLDKPNNSDELTLLNHEYSTGSFSSQYMSRNRVRLWDEQSFTIQASGRQAPLHPSSQLMVKVNRNLFRFDNDDYRRLTIREAARIQTFPDSYKFLYNNLDLGYKMIGNAVPVKFAELLANQIFKDLTEYHNSL